MKPAETFIFFPRSDLMQSERNAWDGVTGVLLAGESADKTKEFVRTRDYMILQDDVARLTLLYTKALNEVAVKEAELERLRKAGDAMCKFFDDHGFYGFGFQEAWNAAKEGKPSV